jgi:hypothetical protein
MRTPFDCFFAQRKSSVRVRHFAAPSRSDGNPAGRALFSL